ncbi:class I SAM-dependent DNA methyltransferase [Cochlodiniinecator piscidefendens]|uniref:class I SAM-dependent DNA methyltransferase n=1 Tax=Cochlodiniinecator piscidefendens TaxID=2715756 RepID=UPI0014089B7D|nr:methyltransferase domain-containing protein [Cochlodiniinecator piscidefendens]
MVENFLDKAYALETAEDTKALYDAWSKSYEDEVGENGYATPLRLATAIAQHVAPDTRILDFGCGTGLCGMALRSVGLTNIDGADLSDEMLKGAQAKGIYKDLWRVQADAPLDFETGTYDAITACGVIGVGAAPIEVFDTLMNALAPKGKLAFSFNDHALADPIFEAKVMEYTDCGFASLLVREYGDHLPGIDMKSMVYVIEKN